MLSERLAELAARYRAEYGVDVSRRCRAPGLRAASPAGSQRSGAELVPGFTLVAEQVGLGGALDGADARDHGRGQARRDLVRREGRGRRARARSSPTLVVAGEIEPGTACPVPVVSLVERFGRERAWADPEGCVAEAVEAMLTGRESATPR